MTTMTHPPQLTRRVLGGVDTHKDVHVAAVLDDSGRVLATASFPTTREPFGLDPFADSGTAAA